MPELSPQKVVVARNKPMLQGVLRGLVRRCPNCGEGHLFAGYLKVAPTCAACGHDNGQYPADDAPPYFTILIVGHLVVAPVLGFPFILEHSLPMVLTGVLSAVGALTMGLLPFVKGAVIGALWSTDAR